MSITLVLRLFILIPIINGYGLELHLIGYIYGLIMIRSLKWQLLFAFLTPWFILIIPPSIYGYEGPFVAFLQLFVEYILALYIFIPFIFWGHLITYTEKKYQSKKATIIQVIIFVVAIIILIALKLLIHTLAGIWWWVKLEDDVGNQWAFAFLFNLPIYAATLGVVMPVSVIVYKPLIKFWKVNFNI